MHWFDELSRMGWLVIFWVACTVLLVAASWLLTRQGRSKGPSSAQSKPRPIPHPSAPRPST